MSLWEEVADIGEEFVEFLEKEIGLGPSEVSCSGPMPALAIVISQAIYWPLQGSMLGRCNPAKAFYILGLHYV